jgi:restriction system protein
MNLKKVTGQFGSSGMHDNVRAKPSEKPVAIWLDDSVAQDRRLYEFALQRVEEEVEQAFEIELFGAPDDAIEFVLRNASRVFMFIQDSSRYDAGKIIPAWKKLRPKKAPDIGFHSHQGDFYSYVIDAFAPVAAAIFAGFSFGRDERELIESWSKFDKRVALADKMGLVIGGFRDKEGTTLARLGRAHLERWRLAQTENISSETSLLKPLAEELAVLCGARAALLDNLSSRQFEELIAALFKNHGFDVHLTAATRDGGYDIVAVSHSALSTETALVEVKHFAPNRPVSVGIVRALYGVKRLHDASKAILATSSYVSRDARHEFARVIPWEIDFIERNDILEWCERYLNQLLMDGERAEPEDKDSSML